MKSQQEILLEKSELEIKATSLRRKLDNFKKNVMLFSVMAFFLALYGHFFGYINEIHMISAISAAVAIVASGPLIAIRSVFSKGALALAAGLGGITIGASFESDFIFSATILFIVLSGAFAVTVVINFMKYQIEQRQSSINNLSREIENMEYR